MSTTLPRAIVTYLLLLLLERTATPKKDKIKYRVVWTVNLSQCQPKLFQVQYTKPGR